MPAGQRGHTAHVIAVFVGDEDGGELPGIAAETLQAALGLAAGKAAVHQDPRGPGLDQGGIAPAATAE